MGDGVHERRLAALEGAEQEHVGLLLADLVDQGLELVLQVEEVGPDLLEVEVLASAAQRSASALCCRGTRSGRTTSSNASQN